MAGALNILPALTVWRDIHSHRVRHCGVGNHAECYYAKHCNGKNPVLRLTFRTRYHDDGKNQQAYHNPLQVVANCNTVRGFSPHIHHIDDAQHNSKKYSTAKCGYPGVPVQLFIIRKKPRYHVSHEGDINKAISGSYGYKSIADCPA